MSEIYKPIIGFEEYYEISNYGNVKRLKRELFHISNSKRLFQERLLTPSLEKKGYLKIRITKDSKVYSFKIHRLVANHFVYNEFNLEQVNHIDGNKLNNHFSNLEWVSNRENINHYHLNTNKTSKYPGVHFKKDVKKWNARIRVGKVRYNLGNFLEEEDATKAYKEAQIKYDIIDKYSNYED